MKIEEAIEILDKGRARRTSVTQQEFDAAVRLGIEALKEILQVRLHSVGLTVDKLPGETET